MAGLQARPEVGNLEGYLSPAVTDRDQDSQPAAMKAVPALGVESHDETENFAQYLRW